MSADLSYVTPRIQDFKTILLYRIHIKFLYLSPIFLQQFPSAHDFFQLYLTFLKSSSSWDTQKTIVKLEIIVGLKRHRHKAFFLPSPFIIAHVRIVAFSTLMNYESL